MTEEIKEKFFENRKKCPGMGASRALAWAKQQKAVSSGPDFDGSKKIVWTEGKFHIHAQLRPDSAGFEDGGGMGSFSRKHTTGAIPVRERCNGVWTTDCYYRPEVTYQEHRKGLREINFGKHEADVMARQYVREDLKRALSFGEDWSWCGIVVEVFDAESGVLLGDASLWGINSDADADYLTSTLADIVSEARSDAMKQIESLRRAWCNAEAHI